MFYTAVNEKRITEFLLTISILLTHESFKETLGVETKWKLSEKTGSNIAVVNSLPTTKLGI